jgi:hypothetical protein
MLPLEMHRIDKSEQTIVQCYLTNINSQMEYKLVVTREYIPHDKQSHNKLKLEGRALGVVSPCSVP